MGKHFLPGGLVFRGGLVPLHGGGKSGDQAGVVGDETESVGVREKVAENACTSGVFCGDFLGLPFRGRVDEVSVKLKRRVERVALQVVKNVFFGVGYERPRRSGVGDFVLVFGHSESLLGLCFGF